MDELSGKRESFCGAEIQLHDERKAEELLWQGLDILEIDDESSLLAMSKGSNEKALLAWLVCSAYSGFQCLDCRAAANGTSGLFVPLPEKD